MIDKQLEGTSVTVVLIGSVTLNRLFVRYEICKSLQRGNAVIGVHINEIRDMRTLKPSIKGNVHTIVGRYNDNTKRILIKYVVVFMTIRHKMDM